MTIEDWEPNACITLYSTASRTAVALKLTAVSSTVYKLSANPLKQSRNRLMSHAHPLIQVTILSSGLPQVSRSGLFPDGFQPKTCMQFPFFPLRATFPAHLIVLDLIILIIFARILQFIKVLITRFSPVTFLVQIF
jgi:hypothetical protein